MSPDAFLGWSLAAAAVLFFFYRLIVLRQAEKLRNELQALRVEHQRLKERDELLLRIGIIFGHRAPMPSDEHASLPQGSRNGTF